MSARRKSPLEIWKFGGASVVDAAAVRNAVDLIRRHPGPVVVVVSALGGVTDALLEGARRSAGGDPTAAAGVAASFLRRHRDIAMELVPPGRVRRELLASADHQAREYKEIAHAVAALGELSPRASDTLIARGERAASAVLAAALHAAGRRAERVDATEVVTTDGTARPLPTSWPRGRGPGGASAPCSAGASPRWSRASSVWGPTAR